MQQHLHEGVKLWANVSKSHSDELFFQKEEAIPNQRIGIELRAYQRKAPAASFHERKKFSMLLQKEMQRRARKDRGDEVSENREEEERYSRADKKQSAKHQPGEELMIREKISKSWLVDKQTHLE